MSEQAQRFTTPVGRFVNGSAHELQKSIDPVTRVQKTGKDGQPAFEYFIGIAIPKEGNAHWGTTEWGKVIWQAAFDGFSGQQQLIMDPTTNQLNPNFAWKIIDGDSAIPNKNGKAPNTNENYKGCWIVQFKTHFAPQLWNADGTQQILGNEFKRGYYVQISSTVRGNNTPANPGVYLNHDMIALSGYADVIQGGPDVSEAKFGGALPSGASATPVGGFSSANVPIQPGQPQMPAQGAAATIQPGQPQMPAQGAAATIQPGQPHTQILNPPVPPQ